MCHMSHFFLSFFLWGVGYQRGLPRLVSSAPAPTPNPSLSFFPSSSSHFPASSSDDAGAGGVSFKCANGLDLDAGKDIHYTSVTVTVTVTVTSMTVSTTNLVSTVTTVNY